jgi:DNA-binding LytR/AlgR family response regulator
MRENGAMFSIASVRQEAGSSDECIREQFAAGLRYREAAVSPASSKPLPQTRTRAIGNAARIGIKAEGRILFIDAADVIAVEAKGNYVLLLHTSGSYMLRESILTMAEKLNPHGFVRVHRSVLVNAALVEEIRPWSSGEYRLRVRGGREFTVTRTYKKNLRLLAQSWIGMKSFAI